MAANQQLRRAHGGYQDAFEAADLLPLAREIAATLHDGHPDHPVHGDISVAYRRGDRDGYGEVRAALSALKWRFYAEPSFRAWVTR